MGARVEVGHRAENIGNAAVICRSTAVPDSNIEILAAREAGRPVLSRAEILEAICVNKRTVAVAGTHGKTTTSSMLALALTASNLNPSFIVGGDLNDIGSGAVWTNEGDLFVVEADESDGTFLRVGAEAAIVTNVEIDHLDFFGTHDALMNAFRSFVDSANGPRVLCADDPGALEIANQVGGCITYGTAKGADYRIEDVKNRRYSSNFSIFRGQEAVSYTHLTLPTKA